MTTRIIRVREDNLLRITQLLVLEDLEKDIDAMTEEEINDVSLFEIEVDTENSLVLSYPEMLSMKKLMEDLK